AAGRRAARRRAVRRGRPPGRAAHARAGAGRRGARRRRRARGRRARRAGRGRLPGRRQALRRGRPGAARGPRAQKGARPRDEARRELPGRPARVGRGVRLGGRDIGPAVPGRRDAGGALRAAPVAAGSRGDGRGGPAGGRREGQVSSIREALLVAAVRTPIGRHGGALAAVRPDDLAALVLDEVATRAGVPKGDVADVFLGCANQAGEDNRNVARMSALLAGYPVSVPGVTVNRLCGSGLEAVVQASRCVMLGEGELYAAGGVESMSRAPWAMPKPERGYATGPVTAYDTSLGWRFVNPRLHE